MKAIAPSQYTDNVLKLLSPVRFNDGNLKLHSPARVAAMKIIVTDAIIINAITHILISH